MVYLDEPINQEVIDNIDYVDTGNEISFTYLSDWKREEKSWNPQTSYNKYNLAALLFKVYNLFVEMPPLTMNELFGIRSEPNNNLNSFDVFLGFQEEEEKSLGDLGNFNPQKELGRI